MLYRLDKVGESLEAWWSVRKFLIKFQARVHGVQNFTGDSENRNEFLKESFKTNELVGTGRPGRRKNKDD